MNLLPSAGKTVRSVLGIGIVFFWMAGKVVPHFFNQLQSEKNAKLLFLTHYWKLIYVHAFVLEGEWFNTRKKLLHGIVH